MKEDQVLDRPIFLILPTHFWDRRAFPEDLLKRFNEEFRRPVLTLLKFTP